MEHPPADFSQCEAEPIHLPGSIQPHGVLLTLHGPTLRIMQATSTCEALLGVALADLLNQDLATIFGMELAEAVRTALAYYLEWPSRLAAFSWRSPTGDQAFSGYVHQSDQLTVLELEPAAPTDLGTDHLLAYALAESDAIRTQSELRAKAQMATSLFRRLTGYDRVMIYQFSADWHGEVIAESRRADLVAYLGLHFPASDIPAQARRLYLLNRAPIIVDVDDQPAPLIPAINPVTGQTLDLSRSLLRSVSPVHRQYLRNMGVQATLATALIRDGELWGMLACHHTQPRQVSRAIRELVDWMAQDLSNQLTMAQECRSRNYAAHLKQCRDQALAALQRGAGFDALLIGPELVDTLSALGAEGAALIRGAEVVIGGVTPTPTLIRRMADELKTLHRPAEPTEIFVTDGLSQHLPWTADIAATAAGVIAFSLDGGPTMTLMGFRGEQLRQVTWGGNPDKALDAAPDGRLSPRQSFAAWAQTVRLRSTPWTREEVESARELRARLDSERQRGKERELQSLYPSVAHLNDIVVITEADPVHRPGPRIVFVNEAFERHTGYSPKDVIGQTPRLLQGPLTDRLELDRIRAALIAWQPVHAELINYRKNGSTYWVEIDIAPVADQTGGFTHWISIQRDISARKQAEQTLQDSEVRYQQVMSQLDEGVIVVDQQGRIISANESACHLLHLSANALENASIFDPARTLIDHDGEMIPPGRHPITLTLQTGVPQYHRVFALRQAAETRWIAFTTKALESTDAPRAVLASFRDITEQRQLETRLTCLAKCDALTGLPNRTGFQERFAQALEAAAQSGLLLGVMLVDLDHFKDVNDSLGHAVGDQLLCAVTQRMTDSLRPDDLIARLGGDEFAICTPPCARVELIGRVGHRITQALQESFIIDGHEIDSRGSVGIAVFPNDSRDAETLLRYADIAMYAAKRDRASSFRFYSPELESQATGHLAARTRLKRAIELGQFELHYQPQVTVKDHRLIGLEALIRWRTEDGQLVSPADFIPVAEETGLIVPLGDWILRRACADSRVLAHAGWGDVVIAINLSGRQFQREPLAREIAAIMAEAEVAAECIELEMTETVIMEQDVLSLRLLRELKEMGCSLAIDDFGTGYSSLAYLCRFPVDTLKIDRAFVHGLAGNPDQLLITKAIVSLGHALGLKTLAEGVETEEELALLKSLGCDEYQGYLYSRARPLPELLETLAIPSPAV